MKIISKVLCSVCLLVLLCGALWGTSFAASVEVSWLNNPEEDGVASYRVHCGTASGRYLRNENAGLNTSATVDGLQEGVKYYFAVSAIDAAGNSSDFSSEASLTIPDLDTGSDPIKAQDSDYDGIPDIVENSMGINPFDPFDSFYDNDLDGVSNYSEYRMKTDMNDFLDYPEFDEFLINMIAQLDENVALGSLINDSSLSVVPVTPQFPMPENMMISFDSEGLFYYDIFSAGDFIQKKLKVSVTQNIVASAMAGPENSVSMTDNSSGIQFDMPEGAAASDFVAGIGMSSQQMQYQTSSAQQGYVFDIMPFDMTLKKPARISVPFKGEKAIIEMYDFSRDEWLKLETEVVIENSRAVFFTKTIGRFRISEVSAGDAVADLNETSEESSASLLSGICFISASI